MDKKASNLYANIIHQVRCTKLADTTLLLTNNFLLCKPVTPRYFIAQVGRCSQLVVYLSLVFCKALIWDSQNILYPRALSLSHECILLKGSSRVIRKSFLVFTFQSVV